MGFVFSCFLLWLSNFLIKARQQNTSWQNTVFDHDCDLPATEASFHFLIIRVERRLPVPLSASWRRITAPWTPHSHATLQPANQQTNWANPDHISLIGHSSWLCCRRHPRTAQCFHLGKHDCCSEGMLGIYPPNKPWQGESARPWSVRWQPRDYHDGDHRHVTEHCDDWFDHEDEDKDDDYYHSH